jgi:hypothetical protein
MQYVVGMKCEFKRGRVTLSQVWFMFEEGGKEFSFPRLEREQAA